MNDLLPHIKGSDSQQRQARSTRDQYAPFDVEAAVAVPGTGMAARSGTNNKALAAFYQKVDEIQRDLAEIKAKKQQFQQLHEHSRAAVTQQDVQEQQASMQATIDDVNRIVLGTKAKLQALAAANAESLQVKGQGIGTASERMRTAITAGLRAKLQEAMGQFSALQSAMIDEYRETVRNRIFTVSGQSCADEDVDRVIDAGEAEGIFQKAIQEQGRGKVLDLLSDIQARHSAVKRLDVSLLELHQMFVDMAALVDLQGQQLDSIEKQVARSVSYVAGGTGQLVEARMTQKNTRQCTCYAGLTAALVAVILIIVLVVVLKPR